MNIKMRPSLNTLLYISIVIFTYLTTVIPSPSCGLYGAPPCQFVPAPPGHTPACARPGKTYCEHADNYPTYLIKHLVHKWGYESKNLIVDETWEDFHALNVPHHDISHFYDPAVIFGYPPSQQPQQQQPQTYFGRNNFNGYNYDTPQSHPPQPNYNQQNYNNQRPGSNNNAGGYPPQESNYLVYSSVAPQNNYNSKNTKPNPPYNGYEAKVSQNTSPSIWLKRYGRDLSKANMSPADVVGGETNRTLVNSRDVSINLDLLDIVGVEGNNRRVKRQSPGRSTLCQTTSRFIEPQAALNSKGNWMFVVNEEKTARQKVKTELCATSTCTNLCQLPNGYTSRCEQKYVQKRLIALQASGQNLYTDTFWFPSCCVCTISNVN